VSSLLETELGHLRLASAQSAEKETEKETFSALCADGEKVNPKP